MDFLGIVFEQLEMLLVGLGEVVDHVRNLGIGLNDHRAVNSLGGVALDCHGEVKGLGDRRSRMLGPEVCHRLKQVVHQGHVEIDAREISGASPYQALAEGNHGGVAPFLHGQSEKEPGRFAVSGEAFTEPFVEFGDRGLDIFDRAENCQYLHFCDLSPLWFRGSGKHAQSQQYSNTSAFEREVRD